MNLETGVIATKPPQQSGAVRLDLTPDYGWNRHEEGDLCLWFKGHVHGTGSGDPVTTLAQKMAAMPPPQWLAHVNALDGHFALVAAVGGMVLAAVDRVGSVPLFYGRDDNGWAMDSQARRLASRLGLEEADPQAALELAMGGQTIGARTLLRGLEVLTAGETALFESAHSEPKRARSYVYLPRPVVSALDDGTWREESRRLADVTMGLFEKMAAGLDGRPVLVPLSAGLDSRLVVCALKELGYGEVKCFSYGRRDNHEAMAARKIADRLGLPWTFVENTPRQQRATFASAECRAFEAATDSLMAVPFHQDFHALWTLKKNGYAPGNAVIVNGQSGDFIAGNHIPPVLFEAASGADETTRWTRIADALIAKHFDLWQCLKTPDNLTRLRAALRADMEDMGAVLGDPENDFAPYEMWECHNRQSKYVMNGQRTYEWFDYEWRLPLWDRAYLDYWAAAPLCAKRQQALYRQMLETQNWGGVWGGEWNFPQTVVPAWMRTLRYAAKLAHAPLGRARWHRFEKQRFDWWMDVTCNYALVPYGRVAGDRRGHRNATSWHAEKYLADKGLVLDGLAPGKAA